MSTSRRQVLVPVACTIMLFCALPARAQTPDESFRADIQKLLDVTNAAQMATQMARLITEQFMAGLRRSQPDIPERATDIVLETLSTEFAGMFSGPDGLMDQFVPLYAGHFTHDEVRGLIAFYQSELGKKLIANMPALTQEAAGLGQQWALKRMPAFLNALEQRLKAEGLIK